MADRRFSIVLLFALSLVLFFAGCKERGSGGLHGTLLWQEKPLFGAQVEVYLKEEKDRSTLPFSVVATAKDGSYSVDLPPGRYFLIGKKKVESSGGRTRMLMAECPVNPLEVATSRREVAPFSLREMGRDGALVAEAGTGIRGRIVAGDVGRSGAYLYVYTEDAAGLMGPSYGEAVQAEDNGTFQVDLPPGRYYLAARWRADGSRVGELTAGDFNGVYPQNPVTVIRGEMLPLADLPLAPVDAELHQQRHASGKFVATGTALAGRVIDEDGTPVRGVYVFAYLDSRMVGKPTYISDPSGADGAFTLHLGEGGIYYVGARSTFGGPLEPGEWIGTYDAEADHRVDAADKGMTPLGDLIVREVW